MLVICSKKPQPSLQSLKNENVSFVQQPVIASFGNSWGFCISF